MGNCCKQEKKKLTIIHFNDAYEIKARNGEHCAGASRFCTLVNSFKHDKPLVLFSGDLWNPSKRKKMRKLTKTHNFTFFQTKIHPC